MTTKPETMMDEKMPDERRDIVIPACVDGMGSRPCAGYRSAAERIAVVDARLTAAEDKVRRLREALRACLTELRTMTDCETDYETQRVVSRARAILAETEPR